MASEPTPFGYPESEWKKLARSGCKHGKLMAKLAIAFGQFRGVRFDAEELSLLVRADDAIQTRARNEIEFQFPDKESPHAD